MAKIVGEVSIGESKPVPIDIKELAEICSKRGINIERGISIKITPKEKELDSERA